MPIRSSTAASMNIWPRRTAMRGSSFRTTQANASSSHFVGLTRTPKRLEPIGKKPSLPDVGPHHRRDAFRDDSSARTCLYYCRIGLSLHALLDCGSGGFDLGHGRPDVEHHLQIPKYQGCPSNFQA